MSHLARKIEAIIKFCDYIRLRSFFTMRNTINRMKDDLLNAMKYLEIMYLIRC